MRYIPNTPADREAMLREIGVSSFADLLTAIPEELRLQKPLCLPTGSSEWEVRKHISRLARRNTASDSAASFLGGGSYDHFIPAAVNTLGSRSEFVTAYTPYQSGGADLDNPAVLIG